MTFFILGSPIGNLKDVSIRYLETLSQLTYLVVEDTKKAGQLMLLLEQRYPNYNFKSKKMIAYYQEVESKRITEIIELLRVGHSIGFLSEAGMPGVADPGSLLVNAIQRYHYPIEVVPGPSAVTTALSLSGFSGKYTLFLGFLPKSITDKKKLLTQVKQHNLKQTINLVFFETPQRIRETIHLCQSLWSNQLIFLGNELTKKHQVLFWSKLNQVNIEQIKEKGEYTAVMLLKK